MKKILYLILPLIYILLDQITKLLIIKNIPYHSFIKLNDYFSIVNVGNTGVAFSMFQNNNIFFIVLVSLVLIYVIFFLVKNNKDFTKLQINSFLLIISGGIGNLIDRIFRGAVVDFIDIGYKNVYRWPAFNIADSCVCVGVTLIIISILFFSKKKNNN
jgi:signal peptidase II